jgi:hypothetical protein
MENDAEGQRFVGPPAINVVVFEGFGKCLVWFESHLYPFKELVGVIASDPGLFLVLCGIVGVLGSHVFEIVDATDDHFTAGCGPIVGKHFV